MSHKLTECGYKSTFFPTPAGGYFTPAGGIDVYPGDE